MTNPEKEAPGRIYLPALVLDRKQEKFWDVQQRSLTTDIEYTRSDLIPHWVKCEERLPEDRCNRVVLTQYGIGMAWCDNPYGKPINRKWSLLYDPLREKDSAPTIEEQLGRRSIISHWLDGL